jgi:hypothetical protein
MFSAKFTHNKRNAEELSLNAVPNRHRRCHHYRDLRAPASLPLHGSERELVTTRLIRIQSNTWMQLFRQTRRSHANTMRWYLWQHQQQRGLLLVNLA